MALLEVWFADVTEEHSGAAGEGAAALLSGSPSSSRADCWECDRTGGLPCSGGRRMSSQHTPSDGTDDYAGQQENELEALASIFGDDFHDLRSSDPWKVPVAGGVGMNRGWLEVDTAVVLRTVK